MDIGWVHSLFLMGTGRGRYRWDSGVSLSNSKTRRGKLSTHKLAALADLGLQWAQG